MFVRNRPVTAYSTGIAAGAKEPEAAAALTQFLSAPAAATAIRKSGMESAGSIGR
jgi:molybdate transport system substrate-binding protein